MTLLESVQRFGRDAGGVPYSLVLAAAVFVVLLLLAIGAQLFYLDRVALLLGRDGPPVAAPPVPVEMS